MNWCFSFWRQVLGFTLELGQLTLVFIRWRKLHRGSCLTEFNVASSSSTFLWMERFRCFSSFSYAEYCFYFHHPLYTLVRKWCLKLAVSDLICDVLSTWLFTNLNDLRCTLFYNVKVCMYIDPCRNICINSCLVWVIVIVRLVLHNTSVGLRFHYTSFQF